MRSILLSLGALASSVDAFPTVLDAFKKAASANEKRVLGVAPGFDAATQYVSTTGEHAFVAPDFEAGDVRGPCPGLNAMANHGYMVSRSPKSMKRLLTAFRSPIMVLVAL